ncbi:DUF1638 domain-containing protein [Opitutus sp. ER46]|uniref:DUF1638 domain-containing protein n=1 Tax=Opitutus sp. ER46 TaxID=2161864 RepID=UPI000D312331|nr:DUF1638 domain-containing protein [Opitutus sp. ER46]PTX94366.1 hypothetical protein DB354_11465 [Opitutus sp. ER46]
MTPLVEPPARPTALIACRVLEAEIRALVPDPGHFVREEWFEVGLHDTPTRLRENLAAAIERAESDPRVEVVALAYGLCGLALVGLTPRRCTLVVPRAHDCLTLFLGSKERYARIMEQDPGTYWYSPGWNRERRVPGPDREAQLRKDYAERFEPDQIEALLEMDREAFAQHSNAGYTDMGLPGDEQQREYARQCAHSLGWRFDSHPGDPGLLRALLQGTCDDARFLIVNPGQRIEHAVDAGILRAVPVTPPAMP